MNERELVARLEKLERSNRRLKHGGLAALVLAAALGAMASTRPVPQKIMAHEFDVVDGAGKARIKLSTTPFSTSVEVLDAQGNRAASMEVSLGVSFITAGKDGGDVAMLTSQAQQGASVGVGLTPDWYAAVAGKSGKALSDAVESYQAQLLNGPSVNMAISPAGTVNIGLQDTQGFSTELGSTGMVTRAGATQETSAASIIMFGNDKDHHVIWQAP